MNQLYHLIPEPAGDWQEGDRAISTDLSGWGYRARPVKAQAGQLWRDKIIQEFADFLPIRLGGLPDSDVAEVTKIAAEVLADVLTVPAQACACEGLRTALELALPHHLGFHSKVGEAIRNALAQPCQGQSNGEQPNLSGRYVPPIDGDKPCAEYDPAGVGAGLEQDGFVQCAQCGYPKSLHPPAAASEAQATPRTDEQIEGIKCEWYDFTRKLERELNQANAIVAALRLELEEAKRKTDKRRDELWGMIYKAEADRDQWRNTAKGWETEVTMWAARCSPVPSEPCQDKDDEAFVKVRAQLTYENLRQRDLHIWQAALRHARARAEGK